MRRPSGPNLVLLDFRVITTDLVHRVMVKPAKLTGSHLIGGRIRFRSGRISPRAAALLPNPQYPLTPATTPLLRAEGPNLRESNAAGALLRVWTGAR